MLTHLQGIDYVGLWTVEPELKIFRAAGALVSNSGSSVFLLFFYILFLKPILPAFKGQSSKIFDLQLIWPGPLTNEIKYFRFWLSFR